MYRECMDICPADGPLSSMQVLNKEDSVIPVGLKEARAGATLTPTGATVAPFGATKMADGAKLRPVTAKLARPPLKKNRDGEILMPVAPTPAPLTADENIQGA
jgi:hypothetical protein